MPDAAPLTVAEAAEKLGLTVHAARDRLGQPVTTAVVSDLLSYVMANGKQGGLWITIQTHANIVAVAALGGLSGVIVAHGFEPTEDTVSRAEEEGIPLLTSPEPAYTLAGRLYELGVR